MKIFPEWCACLFLSVLVPDSHAEGINSMLEPPLGKMVDVGGYSLHINCQGEGAPTVILDSGVGGFSLEWIPVQRLLAGKVRICAYDRAGYAWSEPGPPPRETRQLVRELNILLHADGLEPPYVLVGHSFGGYNVMYYATQFPSETAGLVLVDASHPEQIDRLPDIPARRNKTSASEMVTFFQGQSTLAYYPEDIRPMVMHALSSYYLYRTQRLESMNFSHSAHQVQHAGKLPDVPLLVVSRGKRVWPENPYGDALEREWSRMQEELAGLTPQGRQLIAERSGHLIHLEQPDTVADAILSVVNEVRNRSVVVKPATAAGRQDRQN